MEDTMEWGFLWEILYVVLSDGLWKKIWEI